MVDINPSTGVVNAYTLQPYKLPALLDEWGSRLQMLFTIKALVTKQAGRIYYVLYRCGWKGTPNSSDAANELGIPQGMAIEGKALEIEAICKKIFPVLVESGAVPDPYKYGVIRDGREKSAS